MFLKFIFISLVVLMLLGILLLFIIKTGFQLQYLRLQSKKDPGSVWDILHFNFSSDKERKLRWEAFLLFPMLYPIEYDDNREELNQLKRKIKRIHIGIYMLLIFIIILGVFSEKVFYTSG